GYLNNKEATDAIIDKEGFINTGDIVSIDEQDAAVIGYNSEEEETEIPIAYVTIRNGYDKSQALAEEIQSFVDEKVAPYKKLRGGILFIDIIPKSEAGKILKRLLREKLKNNIKE
ncbi:11713_t:CDS:2, partial [Racocetra fulgida]